MSDELRSILTGTSGLGALLLLAAALTLARRPGGGTPEARAAAARAAALGVVAQAAHAGEELLTGFHRVVPESLGLAPWPASFFVGFNAVWLVIWILAVAALRAGASTAALVPLWFLGLALAANGLAHPLLSLRAGGYVPGLLTSPVAGVVGIVLLARLTAATGRGPAAPGPTPAAVGRSPGG